MKNFYNQVWLPFIFNKTSDAYTLDAGPNVHIITLPEHENEIINSLSDLQVKDYIINKPGGPARSIDEHLF